MHLFYVCGYCDCMYYICEQHVCLVPAEPLRALDPLEQKLRMVVSHHVSAGN